LKLKAIVDESDPERKILGVFPKNLELSMLKIYNDKEELYFEEILVNTFVNS
jgi:hypothetical protein